MNCADPHRPSVRARMFGWHATNASRAGISSDDFPAYLRIMDTTVAARSRRLRMHVEDVRDDLVHAIRRVFTRCC